MLLELKVDDTCRNALAKIRERNYLQKVTGHAEEVMLVGISYDRGRKKYECVVEGGRSEEDLVGLWFL